MKVTLKLSAQQMTRLQEEIGKHNDDILDNKLEYVLCGDVLLHAEPCFNSNQSIVIDDVKGTVTLEGHRCALKYGPIRRIITEATKCDPSELEVLEYQTSDQRLEWWETLRDISETLPMEELIKAPLSSLLDGELSRSGRVLEARERAVKLFLNPDLERRISAELNHEEIALVRRFLVWYRAECAADWEKRHLKETWGLN